MKQLLLIIVFFQLSFNILAQKNKTDSIKRFENHFFNTSYGIVRSSYRDLPTSPLFYNGPGVHFGIGSTDENELKEVDFKSSFNLSLNFAKLPDLKSLSSNYSSVYINIPFYYHHLRRIYKWKYKDYNFLVGGSFIGNINSRLNSSLFNASAGFDVETSFMFGAKINKDISRKKPKTIKFLFIKKNLKEKKRSVDFLLNTGVLNFNYRPNYANLSESEIDGSNTNWVKYALDGYRFSWNGWSLNSQLNFTFHKPNGNRIRWTYEWSAFHIPGKYEPLDFSFHQIHLTLLFKR